MTTLPTMSSSFSSENDERIPGSLQAYMRGRTKSRVYDMVLKEFEKSNLTQTQLAKRMGRRQDVLCRLLGSPGNWTLDTVSDLLFAISAAELGCTLEYPLEQPTRNYGLPDWLANDGARAMANVPVANVQRSVSRQSGVKRVEAGNVNGDPKTTTKTKILVHLESPTY